MQYLASVLEGLLSRRGAGRSSPGRPTTAPVCDWSARCRACPRPTTGVWVTWAGSCIISARIGG